MLPGKKNISIVMCTYNGEQFIREQLDSILRQTYIIDEIIIVDDCSSDKTPEIIQEYVLQSPIIRFHQNKTNLGYTKNFENALLLANNELIAIADQDDIWNETKIEKLIANWKENTLLIYCNSIKFNKKIPVNAKPNAKYKNFTGNDPKKLAVYNTISGHAMIFKKDLLPLALPINEHLFYDWWIAMVAACNGGISYLNETLVFQRLHNKNITVFASDNSAKKKARRVKIICDRHLPQFIDTPNMSAANKLFFEKLYYLWRRSATKNFDMGLFIFLMTHRKIIFNYKVRNFAFFSHLKHSFRLANCPF